MPFITIADAQLAWGDLPLLDRAQMQLDAGERVGLIGRNGTGKSSLMHVLAGRDKLDDGILTRQDGLVSVYLEQEPNLPEAATLRESLLARGRFEDIADEREKWAAIAVSMNTCIACARQANKIPKPLRAVKRKKRRLP